MSRTTSRFAIIALIAVGTACSAHAQDFDSIAGIDDDLTPDDVAALEQNVAQNPDDITSRAKLLSHYFYARRGNKKLTIVRRNHVLWFIEHAANRDGSPYTDISDRDDPEGYALARIAWLNQIETNPTNLNILENASRFFTLTDRELAIDLIEKAQDLDAENPKWPERLGHLHKLNINSNSLAEQRSEAKIALDYFEKALSLSDPRQNSMLAELATTALVAEETAKARGYAKQMLNKGDSDWNAGGNIHHGNMILGRIAMREGNIEEAKKHLLASGKTPGSPTLNSFGPNMSLALELLEAGESEVVLEYFDLCSKFWNRNELQIWAKEVRSGKIPGFGSNLRY